MAASTGQAEAWRSRRAVVTELALAAIADVGPAPLRVVDAGGGTGGMAVALAAAGHEVLVVDPSPDAMAALRRRAHEQGVTGAVSAVQGDIAGLLDVVAAGSADVVICHTVLEMVDDPAAALQAVHDVVRPGGIVSILTATRGGAILGHVLAGRFARARAALDASAPRAGSQDGFGLDADERSGSVLRRYDTAALHAALHQAGLEPLATHGIRIFSDLVPGPLLDDPAAAAALVELERAVAQRPDYHAFAAQLHVVARRPESDDPGPGASVADPVRG